MGVAILHLITSAQNIDIRQTRAIVVIRETKASRDGV
jgi:hypothetical protein